MLQEYKKIMVAIDGSNEARLAFLKAVNVAKRNKAQLLLVHIIDTRTYVNVSSFDAPFSGVDTLMDEQEKNTAEQILGDYENEAKQQGCTNIFKIIEYGSPKLMIARELPQKYEVDLIMLGATGLNAIERLFIGSVSEAVTRNAPCDVLIVRTDLENKASSKDKPTN
ncbi:universal stress protein [Melissococcus plutonius]|uniref:Universal stress protein n=5 Tax=Melissococcus plutonius TaxID=33970 RepID=A0A2Z5Y1P2_9ENTE|nr:universal stress protein [Melissococcus plutonius]BAL61842.1 universal stress protein family [Melissococcus plutonius DAT561]MCV2499340.1 universal stress protein [Melissococcus plutonius]MCV2501763.1 universal stress protein [Melissococcus plutonius]MCV2505589.1 universal stress protein [Melissococcus plutonius]MCV2507896.1 universal stress protein [Melissococcus plutonius]